MYRQESVTPYNNKEDKGEQVEAMFDNIASTYDRLNHLLSWNIDKGWRRKAVLQLQDCRPHHILDVATGTGDFAILLAQFLHPNKVTGIDISEKMMEVGRRKVKAEKLDNVIRFQKEDCMHLRFDDNSFDAVTSAFGIRNFQNLEQGLHEIHRVLRKGGQLSIAELTTPVHIPMRQLFWLYSHTILPVYGNIISKDAKAYEYLTASIEAFPQGEQMMEIFRKIGFSKVSFRRLTFGICTIYWAEK